MLDTIHSAKFAVSLSFWYDSFIRKELRLSVDRYLHPSPEVTASSNELKKSLARRVKEFIISPHVDFSVDPNTSSDRAEYWQGMSQLALRRYDQINRSREDEWQFTREVRIIEKFQQKLATNTVRLRLFKSAQDCIRLRSQERTSHLDIPVPYFEP